MKCFFLINLFYFFFASIPLFATPQVSAMYILIRLVVKRVTAPQKETAEDMKAETKWIIVKCTTTLLYIFFFLHGFNFKQPLFEKQKKKKINTKPRNYLKATQKECQGKVAKCTKRQEN